MIKNTILVLSLFFVLLSGNAQGQQEISLLFQDNENFPYQIGNGATIKWKKPGIAIEMMMLLEKKLKVRIHFKRKPWKRCMFELARNKVDGIFNASYKIERLGYGVYPTKNGIVNPNKRSYANSYHLFKMKHSSLKWDGKKLINVKGLIGAPLGHSVVDDLKKMGVRVLQMKDTLSSLRILKSEVLKGAVDFGLSGDLYLKRYPYMFKNIIKTEPPISTKNYYLMLSHKFSMQHPKLSKDIWDTIEEIRSSEKFQIIADKYFLN
jgi:polar amino acid transport system substrate-binding protein